MRLLRVELHSKTLVHSFELEAGLNVILFKDQQQVEAYVESFCSGALLVPVQSALHLEKLQVEFEIRDGRRFRFHSRKGQPTELCVHASEQGELSNISMEQYRKDFASLLSPQSFTHLAGLNLATRKKPLKRNLSDGDALRSEAKKLESEQVKLQQLFAQVSDLVGQLQIFEHDLALDNKIRALDPKSLERLESAPQAKERFDSRKSLIRSARLQELEAPPIHISLLDERNFRIGVFGIIVSFVVAYISGLPLLALANLFFAALLVQTLLNKIDEHEKMVRMNARRKAVDEADERNKRARTVSNTTLEEIADSVDCELEVLTEKAQTLEVRKNQREQLRKELERVSSGLSVDELKAELSNLSARIARIHEKILEDNFVPAETPDTAKEKDLEREDHWDRMFFRLLKTDLGSDFSPPQLEKSVLEHLQRLSEGRFDGITISDDGALTVVGPDDVFPVSFPKLNEKDQALVSYAVRFGVVSRLITEKVRTPIILQDNFTGASRGRRLRFRDAVEALAQSSQIIVVTTAHDWSEDWVRNKS